MGTQRTRVRCPHGPFGAGTLGNRARCQFIEGGPLYKFWDGACVLWSLAPRGRFLPSSQSHVALLQASLLSVPWVCHVPPCWVNFVRSVSPARNAHSCWLIPSTLQISSLKLTSSQRLSLAIWYEPAPFLPLFSHGLLCPHSNAEVCSYVCMWLFTLGVFTGLKAPRGHEEGLFFAHSCTPDAQHTVDTQQTVIEREEE